jgi:hypothetical protein
MVLLRSIYIKNVFCDYDELELVNKINEEINLSRMQTQTMNTLINFTHNHPQDTNNNNSMMINPILSSMRLFNMRKNNKRKIVKENKVYLFYIKFQYVLRVAKFKYTSICKC